MAYPSAFGSHVVNLLATGLEVLTTLPGTPNPTHPHPGAHCCRTSSDSAALLGI